MTLLVKRELQKFYLSTKNCIFFPLFTSYRHSHMSLVLKVVIYLPKSEEMLASYRESFIEALK